MSSNDYQDDVVLAQRDLSSSSAASDDDEEEEDDEDNDVIDSGSISLPVAIATAPPAVTVARHAPPPPATMPTTISDAVGPKRPRTAHYEAVILPSLEEKKPVPAAAAIDDSRRLFQRLWTDEDEIELLQGFLDYTNQRGGANRGGGGGGGGGGSHQNDTALFYDQIKSKLQLEFNKNQLVEKLRRLKKKYRNLLYKLAAGKEVTFKSPHDRATFEISKKIWSNFGAVTATAVDDNALDDEDSNPNIHNFNLNHYEIKSEESPPGFFKSTPQRPRKRQRPPPMPKTPSLIEPTAILVIKENHHNVSNGVVAGVGGSGIDYRNCNVQGMIEETVKSCVSPLFRELMSNSMGGGGQSRGFGGLSLNLIPLSFGGPAINLNFGSREAVEEPWRKQQILELEVYSKRLELVQNQIKLALDELRSAGGG